MTIRCLPPEPDLRFTFQGRAFAIRCPRFEMCRPLKREDAAVDGMCALVACNHMCPRMQELRFLGYTGAIIYPLGKCDP